MSIPKRAVSSSKVSQLQVALDEVAANRELAADRLPDARSVQRPGERIGDVVGDGAVVLVARVERRHEVVAALEDRPGQQLDPLGRDAAQVGVDHDEGLDLQLARDLEQGAHRGPLAADALVGEADPLQLVARADQDDLLDVVGALGADRHPRRVVRRPAVAVHQDRLEVREVLDHAGGGGAHDVADRLGVAEARDAHHQVGVPHAADLAEPVLVERRLRRRGRVGRQDRPPAASSSRCSLGCSSVARAPADRPRTDGGSETRSRRALLRSWVELRVAVVLDVQDLLAA